MTILDAFSDCSLSSMPIVALTPSADPVALINVPGVTLMHALGATPVAAELALKTLRDFRAVRRRVVWCHASELARTPNVDLANWGRKLVSLGQADMVVACGPGARDIAVAARDAGLSISRVVVCGDESTARNVLADSIVAGDTILALGTTPENCYKLAERLESRFERELLVAG